MANIYDQNVKLQAIADAITNQSITITTGQDLLDALADIANAMQPAAANISYDNTNSGLQAVNVQQAVDENADNISTLNSSLSSTLTTQGLVPQHCTIVAGGYAKIGNFVIINLRVSHDSSSANATISGFPSYSGSYNRAAMSAYDYGTSTWTPCSVDNTGTISIISDSQNGFLISGVYAIS